MPAYANALEHVPEIVHSEREAVERETYFWDNRNREPSGTVVIQRTLSGAAVLIDRRGEQEVPPGKAMLFVYGEATAYRIGQPGQRPYIHEYTVIRSAGGISELVRQIREDFGSVLTIADNGEGARLIHEICGIFRERQSRDQLQMAELAYRLLLAVYREQLTGIRGSDPVSYLRFILQTRFRSPKNLKEWMSGLGMTREHLTRQFAERYGEGPAAYLRHLRLNHARLLARTTIMPVEDIASASGFGSAQTFRRAYRRQFGMPVGVERPASRLPPTRSRGSGPPWPGSARV
ncbi:MAG: helix-turn-helix domain-containing protein [Oceanipulchritudo sp.]